MGIDHFFEKQASAWVNYMFDEIDKQITVTLRTHSKEYQKLKNRLEDIYTGFPEIVKVLEKDEVGELNYSKKQTEKLSEAIDIQIKIMELYQRMAYVKGVMDGIKISEDIRIIYERKEKL